MTATILVNVVVFVESGVDASVVFRKKAAVATDAVEVIITGGPIVGIPTIVVVRRRLLANTPAGLVHEQEIPKKKQQQKKFRMDSIPGGDIYLEQNNHHHGKW